MPISSCESCGVRYQWSWEEAFDKYGFDDGDERVETFQVADVLERAGFVARSLTFGLHNIVIISIKKKGVEQMPIDNPDVQIGFSDPRSYLPEEVIRLLDRELPFDEDIEPV